jgi:arylsulfatase A-like enzyme
MASTLTMTFPSTTALHTRLISWRGSLPESEVTVAELMRDAGRATFWASHDISRNFSRGHIAGLDQGIDTDRIHRVPDGVTTDEQIVVHAISELRALSGKRYFGWVFLPAPHAPYRARAPTEKKAPEKERYLSEIKYADAQLGRLLEELRALSALEHTIVIIAGDHGEEFGDHGGTQHRSTVYSEVTHVPLLVHIPGSPGRRHSQPTSLVYVFPWLFSRGEGSVRTQALTRIEGNLVPMMRATGNAVVIELFSQDSMLSALVYPQLKLNHNLFANHTAVFDLERDPGEHHDILIDDDPRALKLLPFLQGYLDVRRTTQRFTMQDRGEPASRAPKPKKKRGAQLVPTGA